MQITIVQSEIETAIRNYVMEQVNVKEGKRIDIDLKATRGDSGYTAEITIANQDAPEPKKTSASKPLDIEKNIEEARKTEAPAKEEAKQPATETTKEVSDTPASDTAKTETDTGSSDEALDPAFKEDTAKSNGASKPSIFASMKKPDNSKAAEASS